MADLPIFERAHLNRWASSSANPLGDINAMASKSRAKYLEMTTVGVDMPPLLPDVEELLNRQAEAEFAARESAARATLTARVREAIVTADEHSCDLGEAIDGDALAAAAVDVFLGMLKNPPAFVTHPDGHTEIEWPKPPGGEQDG